MTEEELREEATSEERRQSILESKRRYNKAHREERIAYMKQWRKSKR